jgi:hypothetical protein
VRRFQKQTTNKNAPWHPMAGYVISYLQMRCTPLQRQREVTTHPGSWQVDVNAEVSHTRLLTLLALTRYYAASQFAGAY